MGRGLKEFKGSVAGITGDNDDNKEAKKEAAAARPQPVEAEVVTTNSKLLAVAKVRAKPVSHEEEISLVDHLDELRTRIITSLMIFGVALALCFWQNKLLLDLANGPLPGGREPITFGVAEPFTTTLTVAAYGAILLSLPALLYQAYAFILPALKPTEKKTVMPFLLMAPFLFVAGVVFAYIVVMPAATEFLLNFNDDQFNIEVRAREYYSFFAMCLISVGVLFQIPTGILGVTRLGIVTPAADRREPALRDPGHRGAGDAAARARTRSRCCSRWRRWCSCSRGA